MKLAQNVISVYMEKTYFLWLILTLCKDYKNGISNVENHSQYDIIDLPMIKNYKIKN